MNTFTWSILKIICNSEQNNQNNVVIRVRWQCIGTNDINSTEDSKFCDIPFNSTGTFIDYADLTESQVLSWVWTVVNKSEIESKLAQVLARRNNPPVSLPLPWS